jgi:hypothetical protein
MGSCLYVPGSIWVWYVEISRRRHASGTSQSFGFLLENIASHHAVSGVDGFANQGHTVARSKTGQVARRDI